MQNIFESFLHSKKLCDLLHAIVKEFFHFLKRQIFILIMLVASNINGAEEL